MQGLIACHTCGLVQRLDDDLEPGAVARCARCGSALYRMKRGSLARTAAFALAALILYWPANVYPIVHVDYMGYHSDTTIFNGVRSLIHDGEWFTGGLVFTTSILTPFLKILGLLLLVLTAGSDRCPNARTWLFKAIEFVDPWNMLEVFLLAILISIMEMGRLATVVPGPAVFSFSALVFMTILASLSFDPRIIWEREEEGT